jgi:hypothetical protein
VQNNAARRGTTATTFRLGSVVITGTGLGLPGARKRFMDPDNAQRILRGEQFVDLLPERFRKEMAQQAHHAPRQVGERRRQLRDDRRHGRRDQARRAAGPSTSPKSTACGKAGRGARHQSRRWRWPPGSTPCAKAGIPLVQTFKKTTKGTYLPDRWMLPESLRDETGVIFASAFPGGDRFSDELSATHQWESKLRAARDAGDLRRYTREDAVLREIDRRLYLREEMKRAMPTRFDRRFLFRVLAMGHSQFAEYVGARGPNTQVNAACASTTQGWR